MGKDSAAPEYIATARHSLAHVLAKAVCELFDDVKLGIGPNIDNGFYYDFDLPHTLKEEDFSKIEAKMTEIINRDMAFTRRVVDNAKEVFAGDPYKLELITEFSEAGSEITAYDLGDFCDLCAGPHVESTRELRNWGFSLASVAGAYWRGNSDNAMLQRVYVHAFPTRQELKKYHQMLEEAKKRDHRVLGNQLDLFFLDETAPGMPYWLPKGLKLYNTLMDFVRGTIEARGYQEICGPQLNNRSLWEVSGHWEHYQDNMFTVKISDDNIMALKPMNCPNAIKAFGRKNRSYRELPLRYADMSVIHRKEVSGTLHGLMRVQAFRQDDAHIFLTEQQIYDEINRIFDITDKMYGVFGLSYRPVLSTRPEQGYLGDIATWDSAEDALKKVLDSRFGGEYEINEGDGAFYGPKIDVYLKDALGREWQMCTIQLDFQLASRFDIHYVDNDGRQKPPIIIHRTIIGAFERIIGVLIEHYAGKFPFWLSPVQIGVVPVHTEHEEYAQKITETLRASGYRTNIDTSDGTMGNKIKSFRHEMVPYIVILGEKEIENNTISLRSRNGTQINDISLESFMTVCQKLEKERLSELIELF